MKLWGLKLKSSFTNILQYLLILLISLIISCEDSTSISENFHLLSTNKIKYIAPYNVLYPNTTLDETFNYEFANGPCSNQINCFLPYGICVNETTCMCMPEYAHVYIEGYSLKDLSCSYKKKKTVVAGLLELFLPIGMGHFYVGHLFLGTLKLFYNFLVYTFCCVLYCKGSNNNSFADLMIFCVFLCCVIPIWNIFDIFLFFGGGYYDGNGVPLY